MSQDPEQVAVHEAQEQLDLVEELPKDCIRDMTLALAASILAVLFPLLALAGGVSIPWARASVSTSTQGFIPSSSATIALALHKMELCFWFPNAARPSCQVIGLPQELEHAGRVATAILCLEIVVATIIVCSFIPRLPSEAFEKTLRSSGFMLSGALGLVSIVYWVSVLKSLGEKSQSHLPGSSSSPFGIGNTDWLPEMTTRDSQIGS
jgi:hypothetical protein